jgi:DNA adenine methylase
MYLPMVQKFRNISPFRYPGSKQALIPYFLQFLEVNNLKYTHLYEPFAGGASLSLGLLAVNAIKTATIVDRDPLIYAFWKCVRRDPKELCHRLWKLKININTWKSFQKYLCEDAENIYDLMDLAVAGIFFNRVNFSGVIAAKPIGGMTQSSNYAIDCRWNIESLVDKISLISEFGSRLRVKKGDAISFLKRSESAIKNEFSTSIVYIDPPYYVQGPKLYRHHFDESQHNGLAEYLNECGLPWLCSYDDAPKIHELFSGKNRKILPINLQYTVRSNRQANELLITNMPWLPQPELAGYPCALETSSNDTHGTILNEKTQLHKVS